MRFIVTSLFLLGPRAALVAWWFLQPARWDLAFGGVLWPLLGLFLAPWTTLSYIAVAPGGVTGSDWAVLGMGVLVDVMFWGAAALGNRDRLPGSSTAA